MLAGRIAFFFSLRMPLRSHFRNGLEDFSRSTVVSGPCPQYAVVSPGKVSSFVRIDAIN